MQPNELREIYEVEEGIENRLNKSCTNVEVLKNSWKKLKQNAILGQEFKEYVCIF